MIEEWYQTIPDTVAFDGLVFGASREALLWAGSPVTVYEAGADSVGTANLLFDPDGRHLVPTSGDPMNGLFDRNLGEFVPIVSESAALQGTFLQENLLIEAATVSEGRVYLSGRHAEGYAVLVFDEGGGPATHRVDVENGSTLPPHSARLIPGNRGPLISFMGFPFSVWKFDEGLTPQVLFDVRGIAEVDGGLPPMATLSFWISIAFLPLDRGFLLELADPTSDDRLLVVLNEEGSVRRTRRLSAAIGFVASDPESKVLFAVRSLDQRELVKYRWRWTDTSGEDRIEKGTEP